jgi:DNA-binding beta-propeller fold protein YncE
MARLDSAQLFRYAALVVTGLTLTLLLILFGCTAPPADPPQTPSPRDVPSSARASSPAQQARPGPRSATPALPAPFRDPLPGMPPVIGLNVYGATRAGMLSPKVAHDPALLYVPDSTGSRVTVISQRTRRILRILHTGSMSQHVTPSYDLRHLYTNSSSANALIAIDPRTGKRAGRRRVPRPYNLYFTPDGRQAVVMSEQHDQIRFSNPNTFRPIAVRHSPACRGPNHADFSANGQYLLVSCEFSGVLLRIATRTHRILGTLRLGSASMPQDVRLSPDGRVFYVALMGMNRVALVDGDRLRVVGEIKTPAGPHGLYPSRDGTRLYVSDRGAGAVSVISFASRRIVATWRIRGGGSPDMGGVSADGRRLWLTGRYDGVVYGFDTRRGRLVARIRVGGSPHGMAVWPQPGRYSLGHTGNMR